MKVQYLLLAFASIATAELNVADWHPPVEGDVRSPCPVLNAMANHGFIPRNGKNLEKENLIQAMGEALNVSTDVGTTLFGAGLQTSSNPASGTFSLDDLNKHNIIEHDASLSRKDTITGDSHTFCSDVFGEYIGHFAGQDITVPAQAAARWGRVQTEKARNQAFTYSESNRMNSYVESAVLLELFRIPETAVTKLDFVKTLFEQERLPFDEGWRPLTPITGFSLIGDVLQLALNTNEKAPTILGVDPGFHGGMIASPT